MLPFHSVTLPVHVCAYVHVLSFVRESQGYLAFEFVSNVPVFDLMFFTAVVRGPARTQFKQNIFQEHMHKPRTRKKERERGREHARL